MTDDDRPADPTSLVLAHLAELNGIPEDVWTEGTITDLGLRLHRLRVLQSVVRKAEQAVEDTLVDSMETDTVDVPGMGRLFREERSSSAWKSKQSAEQLREHLTLAVARVVALDIETGEIDQGRRNLAIHTMRTALTAIPSFSSLLKGGAKALDLRIRDYRDYSTHYTVTVDAVEEPG